MFIAKVKAYLKFWFFFNKVFISYLSPNIDFKTAIIFIQTITFNWLVFVYVCRFNFKSLCSHKGTLVIKSFHTNKFSHLN